MAALVGLPPDFVTSQQALDARVVELRAERERIAALKPTRPSYL